MKKQYFKTLPELEQARQIEYIKGATSHKTAVVKCKCSQSYAIIINNNALVHCPACAK